jgi:osmotically-inducible protein OsmY
VVTLHGTVEDVETIVRAVPGVEDVMNGLRVT